MSEMKTLEERLVELGKYLADCGYESERSGRRNLNVNYNSRNIIIALYENELDAAFFLKGFNAQATDVEFALKKCNEFNDKYAVSGLTACYVEEERRIYVYKVIEWPHDELNERIADYLEGVMGLIYDFFTE